MKLEWNVVRLELRRPFRISRGLKTHQTSVIVRLADDHLVNSAIDDGLVGYGEASPNEYYGIELTTMKQSLCRCADALRHCSIGDESQVLDVIGKACGKDTFSKAACDIAFHDLVSRRQNLSVSDWLYKASPFRQPNIPATSITIGLGSLDEIDEQLEEFAAWPILKVKLGGSDDLDVISHIRRQSSAVIRVDANGGWTPEQAVELSRPLADLGVQFIEQPIPPGSAEAQRFVYRRSALPVIADESCVTVADIAACSGLFGGINIKLGKCGGIAQAMSLIALAHDRELSVMIGCMTESSIAMAAGRALADRVDFVDLDGSTLLKNDPSSGFVVVNGELPLSIGTGLDVVPDFCGC